MALRDYGKPENDLGEWFPFGPDIDLRVRRIPYDVASRIRKKYGKEESVIRDGVRYKEFVQSSAEIQDMMVEQACFALTDIRGEGAKLTAEDAEGASLWTGYLKREVAVGDILELQGSLVNDALKKRLIVQIKPYAVIAVTEKDKDSGEPTGKISNIRYDIGSFILERALELNQRAANAAQASESN